MWITSLLLPMPTLCFSLRSSPICSLRDLSRQGLTSRWSLQEPNYRSLRRGITSYSGCHHPHGLSMSSVNGEESSRQQYSTRTLQTLPPIAPHCHRFVLMRHGESEFNNANIFTGWCDVALTPRGVVEAVEAGQVFRSHNLAFRKCYASLLTRSIVTAHRALEAAGVAYTPLEYVAAYNERHYGALQGLSKERTAQRLGRALVLQWRRSYDARPPLMTKEHPHYPIINDDARYKHMHVPLGESLADCQKRVVGGWKDTLKDVQTATSDEPDYSLIVAHANSLRALVMYLDDIPADEIEGLNIPTAIPFFYDVDKRTGHVVDNFDNLQSNEADRIALGRFRGIYIADERKKRSFLERRRAANDPWLWALHDHQVARSMLVADGDDTGDGEGLTGLEDEAKHNTEVFSTALKTEQHPDSVQMP